MKVLFTDIEGVLLNEKCYKQINDGKKTKLQFNPESCECINYIDRQVPGPVGIVIISTWRNEFPLSDLKWIFTSNGIGVPILGATGLHAGSKSMLIEDWLNNYEYPVLSYVIITSDNHDLISRHRRTRLVLCTDVHGLKLEQAEKAIKILND